MRSDPFVALNSFADALGWHKLRRYQQLLPVDGLCDEPQLVTWFESGCANGTGRQFCLMIQEYPIGNEQIYTAAVYAIRFRIFTHFHEFQLSGDSQCDPAEAVRLEPLLHRRWFRSLAMRRKYRATYPEFADFTWERIRFTRRRTYYRDGSFS